MKKYLYIYKSEFMSDINYILNILFGFDLDMCIWTWIRAWIFKIRAQTLGKWNPNHATPPFSAIVSVHSFFSISSSLF